MYRTAECYFFGGGGLEGNLLQEVWVVDCWERRATWKREYAVVRSPLAHFKSWFSKHETVHPRRVRNGRYYPLKPLTL